MQYVFQLSERRVKPHQTTAMHLIAGFAFLGAGAILAAFNPSIRGWGVVLLVVGLLLNGITIFKNKLVTQKGVNEAFRIAEVSIALAIATHALLEGWRVPGTMFCVLGACIVLAIFIERDANSTVTVQIDEDGAWIPLNGRKKLIKWWEIDQVMYKYGTLSVDCLDNRLYQWAVLPATAETQSFEAFCAEKVTAHSGQRSTGNW